MVLAACLVVLSAACGGGDDQPLSFESTLPSAVGTADAPTASSSSTTPPASTDGTRPEPADVSVMVDASDPGEPISPLIVGVSSTLTAAQLRDVGVAVNSWGGNPSSRYNYTIGHAWNHGADYEYRNVNYNGDSTADSNRTFLGVSAEAGIESRVAVPTLGWVARDDLDSTCSFPDDEGGCLGRDEVGDCANPERIADPRTANVESTPEGVADWIGGLVEDGFDVRFIAMDNEPELWGATHFDVHAECPTYEEILDTYLSYARAVGEVAPDAELTGPVMCCWFDYWRTAPGPADGSGQDFLEWFLQQVKAHDDEYGQRTLDVVDVHYYPQSNVFNEDTDPETNARRLRSTRSLWDPEYQDESWITEPIRFIPRMKEIIERSYPGTPLFISEWNFGADTSANGAVTIADVLGIYGREGVYAAAYWRNPPVGSPGYLAFKMHGNYDDQGSRFGGRTVTAVSSDDAKVSAFAALDEATGMLKVMLINKQPEVAVAVDLELVGFDAGGEATTYTYGPGDPDQIVSGTTAVDAAVEVAPSSIMVLELEPAP